MNKTQALKTIASIAFAGILFSGFLSYKELFGGSCNTGIVYCGVNTGPIFGVPACVVGLVMYLIVFSVAILGLKSKSQ